jgi:hypothetical protein
VATTAKITNPVPDPARQRRPQQQLEDVQEAEDHADDDPRHHADGQQAGDDDGDAGARRAWLAPGTLRGG